MGHQEILMTKELKEVENYYLHKSIMKKNVLIKILIARDI